MILKSTYSLIRPLSILSVFSSSSTESNDMSDDISEKDSIVTDYTENSIQDKDGDRFYDTKSEMFEYRYDDTKEAYNSENLQSPSNLSETSIPSITRNSCEIITNGTKEKMVVSSLNATEDATKITTGNLSPKNQKILTELYDTFDSLLTSLDLRMSEINKTLSENRRNIMDIDNEQL